MVKRCLSLFLAFLFALSLVRFTASSVSAYDEFPDNAPEGAYTAGLGITEAQYFALRTRLFTAARNCDALCDISDFGFSYVENNRRMIADLVYDYDALSFHVDQVSFNCENGRILSVSLTYNCTAVQYASKKADMVSAADEILSGIEGNDSLSDLEKALLIHDRLAVRCEYNVETLQTGEIIDDDYTAYGALVRHITMCEGYSKAYCYLLNRVGIGSYLVDSVSLGHMWNVVYIDGEKYHVDVTWDDPVPNKQGQVKHTYFLRSTSKFRQLNHNAYDYDMSPSSTVYDGDTIWNGSSTEYVLCGGSIYYLGGNILYRINGSSSEEVEWFVATWYAQGGYYPAGFRCTATDGNYVYVSLPESIVRYDPSSGERSTVYEFKKGNYWSIYGMTYRDGLFYIDPYNSPNFDFDTEKLYGFTYEYTAMPPHTHIPGEPVTENEVTPTCERYGRYDEVVCCTVCGEEISRTTKSVLPLGHDYVEFRIEPTCEYDGMYESKCSRCGDVRSSVVIPAHHSFGNVYTVKPKCTEQGGKKQVCSVCGFVKWEDVTPALGHDFSDEFTIDREPTYTEEGEMSRHCTRCRERTDIKAIPKLDRLPGDMDGDGEVTMKDVLMMRRSIAGLDELDADVMLAGDIDGDGEITMKDVLAARRMIAGLD